MVGNTPNYSRFDVIRCFLRLGMKISRQQLTRELELGEGTVRSILDILKQRGFILSNTQGHALAAKGLELDKKVASMVHVKPIQLALYPKSRSVAALVSSNARITYENRDIAVKAGAQGALIAQVRNHKLVRPDASVEQDFLILEKEFRLEDSEIMIITFSESYRNSENAALSVAASLNPELGQLIAKNFS
ncbi:hypothetical protein HYV81_06465 [Candidatus Woesearchaeota archaeon]|nr:hypothetical protein [Candidatus Woesearchaeota archaeon]